MTTITLDLNDPQRVLADLHAAIDATGNGNVSQRLRQLHDAIDRQLPKPRIPEPSLYGVVESGADGMGGHRGRFVHTESCNDARWFCSKTRVNYRWDDLIDPVLIREGI